MMSDVEKRMLRTCSDAECSGKVVYHGPNRGLELESHPECLDAAVQRNADDQRHIKPVNMLMPVRPGHRSVCDVCLLEVIVA